VEFVTYQQKASDIAKRWERQFGEKIGFITLIMLMEFLHGDAKRKKGK
jgi:hypothetical protein